MDKLTLSVGIANSEFYEKKKREAVKKAENSTKGLIFTVKNLNLTLQNKESYEVLNYAEQIFREFP